MPDRLAHAAELEAGFRHDPGQFSDADLRRAVPEWLFDFAEAPAAWLACLQQRPRLWLRTRRGQAESVIALLKDATPGPLPDSLLYAGPDDLFRLPEFQAGDFQLQDISSQAVGWICAPQPRQLWWDTCAGEGGKLLHLASLMGCKGSVWATDRAAWRLQRLKLRARRTQVFNYRLALWDGGPELPTDLRFDGVLVDAPCAGIGTWQRNPHARWTARPEDITEMAETQKRLLHAAIPGMKPGAKLVYAVCTSTAAETHEVVAAFEQAHPDFRPLPFANPFDAAQPPAPTLMLWPQTCGGNAMFVAAWQKAS
jgi:16S rRNA (cytosine967-C5)-methyltransferase